jgi:hypothetical protein
METTAAPARATTTDAAGATLAAPSALPRRLALVGMLLAVAGVAALTAALVPAVLVGFDDPAASGPLTPPVPLGIALTFTGGTIANLGLLLARADGRR